MISYDRGMPMFSQRSLSELRAKVDLVELVSGYVKLSKSGTTYKGLCPFHKEKSSSFLIRQGDTHYHCFGCSAHGDAISFLMELEKFSFIEAIHYLSQKFNVLMDFDEDQGQDQGKKRAYREIMRQVTEFFHFSLLHTKEGEQGLKYLYQRGFDLPFIKRFCIGWSLKDDAVVMGVLKKICPNVDDLLTLGLVKRVNNKVRPFFYSRVMFPILDDTSSPVGFTGRIIDDTLKAPKYVNTPETPLFKKGQMLFGLFASRSRIIKEKKALVVEGQIDALRLIDQGFDFVVASQGTAFGSGHVQKLKRLEVSRVYLCFDSDNAGKTAALKVGNLLQKEAIEVFVIILKEGVDPDTLLKNEGKEAFVKELQKGVDYLSFAFDEVSVNYNLNNPASKQQLANELLKLVDDYSEPIMVSEAIKFFAKRMDVDPLLLQKKVFKPVKKVSSKNAPLVDGRKILERDLIRAVLLSTHSTKEMVEIVKNNLNEEDFTSEKTRALFSGLMKIDLQASFDLMHFLQSLDSQIFDFAQKILSKKINEIRVNEVVQITLEKILEHKWMLEREEIKKKMEQKGLDDESVLQLAKEFDIMKKNRPKVKI